MDAEVEFTGCLRPPNFALTAPRTAPTTSTVDPPVSAETMQPPIETSPRAGQPTTVLRHHARGPKRPLAALGITYG